jgi:uncharacterized protein (TIGR02996 family)
MSIDQAFLTDILEHSHDDAPRLVYADWLEENGDPERAEFIRAQCELARHRLPGGTARRRVLARKVKELLKAHGQRWAKGYGEWCYGHPEYWERGFPGAAWVRTTLKEAASRIPLILASAPVREVRIGVRGVRRGEGAALAACPDLARLTSLQLFGEGVSDESLRQVGEIEPLLRSPYLQQIERLDLVQVGAGEGGMQAILALPRLRQLYLYMTCLDNTAARALCRSPLAARLTELRLGADFTAAAKAVAQTPALASLRVLDFDNSTLGDTGARHLAGAAHLAGLRELRLHNCSIRDDGAAALASSPYLKQLRTLVLSRNVVMGAGVASLIRSKTLPRSLDLELWDNHIEDYAPQIRQLLRQRFRRVNFARSH